MTDRYAHYEFPEAVDHIFRETLDKLGGDERPLLWRLTNPCCSTVTGEAASR